MTSAATIRMKTGMRISCGMKLRSEATDTLATAMTMIVPASYVVMPATPNLYGQPAHPTGVSPRVDLTSLPGVRHAVDLGFDLPDTVARGSAYLDLDSDGVRDPGEPGIGHVLMGLCVDMDGTLREPVCAATALNETDGSFEFSAPLPQGAAIAAVVMLPLGPGWRIRTDVSAVSPPGLSFSGVSLAGGFIDGTWNAIHDTRGRVRSYRP